MSDSISIRSAPPSYCTINESTEPEEDEDSQTPVMESSAVDLVLPTTSSSETLIGPRATLSRNISNHNPVSASNRNNGEVRGPFTFSPLGTNAMLLLPHLLSPNSRPLYHISVSQDFFRPHIVTTTIHRGGSDKGQFVAEIKRPLCEHERYEGTVQIGQKVGRLETIHERKGIFASPQERFDWRFQGKGLRWETHLRSGKVTSVQCTRYRVENAPILASFRPSRKRGELPTLEIFPEGQLFMDDILVSCLATESRRSTKYDR